MVPGQSQFLTAPTMAKSLNFNLSLHEPDDGDAFARDLGDDDARMAQLLAAQARTGDLDSGEMEEDELLQDPKLSPEQKSKTLQDLLFLAAARVC